MPPRRTTRQRAAQQAQFKRSKPTKRHFLKNFITQQPKRKRLYAHSQPLNETNNGTVVRVIIGLLVLHVVVIGGVLMHDQLEKSGNAPEFEKKQDSSAATIHQSPTGQAKTPPDSKIVEGRKATVDAKPTDIVAPVKPAPTTDKKAANTQVREVTAVVASPRNSTKPHGSLPPTKVTPIAVIDSRESNKSSHQRREEARPGVYKVVSGEQLKDIALRFGVSEQDLRKANPNITAYEQLYAGQSIIIPRASAVVTPTPARAQDYPDTDTQDGGRDIILDEMDPYVLTITPQPHNKPSGNTSPPPTPQPVPEIRETEAVVDVVKKTPPKTTKKGITVIVRRGQTLSGIAKKYGVTVPELCKLNSIPPSQAGRIKINQKIKVIPRKRK